MVGHLYDSKYDAPGSTAQLPASLSPVWIGQVLRGKLGYSGVVISDDLEMGAIRNLFKSSSNAEIVRQTVIEAVNAGVNVLLFSNTAGYDPSLAARSMIFSWPRPARTRPSPRRSRRATS